MTFKNIYNLTVKFWPSEINISDGKMVEQDGGNFQILSKIWDGVEMKTENESEFIKLMVWGIFCAYHKKAINNFLDGKKTVSLAELDMEYLKHKFEESLLNTEHDEYAESRAKYIRKQKLCTATTIIHIGVISHSEILTLYWRFSYFRMVLMGYSVTKP